MSDERWRPRYAAVEARRPGAAMAPLAEVRTVEDSIAAGDLRAVGSDWSRGAFDGSFFESFRGQELSMGVVFVQSREGNTGTRNPAGLGGGAVDEHLIYEGLSR